MKYTSPNYIYYTPYYPTNFASLPISHSNSPIPYNDDPIKNVDSEERLIPFIGGALIGGLAGSTFARPNYYGYQTPYYNPYYYPYYQPGSYYSYGGRYIPYTYNTYYYPNTSN